MDINKAIEIVNNAKTNKFHVINTNGEKKIIRLFVSANGYLCFFRRCSSRNGFPLSSNDLASWDSVVPVKPTDINLKVKHFLQNVAKYLNESGLWTDIKEDYEKILAQGDDYLKHVLSLDYTEQREYMNKTINASFHVDSIVRSALKGIVSINYNRYEKDELREEAKKAIKDKTNYRHSWRKGYDNSIEFTLGNDGKMRGWYSEEFKNCGNGHYYFAIDERRAIFGEDD